MYIHQLSVRNAHARKLTCQVQHNAHQWSIQVTSNLSYPINKADEGGRVDDVEPDQLQTFARIERKGPNLSVRLAAHQYMIAMLRKFNRSKSGATFGSIGYEYDPILPDRTQCGCCARPNTGARTARPFHTAVALRVVKQYYINHQNMYH